VADNSLLAEAIRIGLRRSGELNLVGHANGRRTSVSTIVDASPDVVLVDDMEQSAQTVDLIRGIKAENEDIAVFVLAGNLDPAWLEQVFDAGATGAIAKATHPTALGTLISETIKGHIVHPAVARSSTDARRTIAVVPEESATPSREPLTSRELEVLQLVASGLANNEIAQTLRVTRQTVKFHLSNVYRKLNVDNRTKASHYAHQNGMMRVSGLEADASADTSPDPASAATADQDAVVAMEWGSGGASNRSAGRTTVGAS